MHPIPKRAQTFSVWAPRRGALSVWLSCIQQMLAEYPGKRFRQKDSRENSQL